MPLLWLSLALIAGNIAAAAAALPLGAWLVCAGLSLAWLFGQRRFKRISSPELFGIYIPLILLFFFTGSVRYEWARPRLEMGTVGWYASSPDTSGQRYRI